MNRVLRLVLLVSLGLNLGLGWAVLRGREATDGPPPQAGHRWRERPAPADSAAWRRMMEHRLERLAARLDLAPDQSARLRALQEANGPLVRAGRDRIEAARQAVRRAADGGAFDDARVREALRGLRRAQADLDSLTQEFLLQECAVMNEGQRARYLELLPLDPWRSARPDGPGGPDGPGEPDGRRRGGGRRHGQ